MITVVVKIALEPKVSAIVINWNGFKDTLECIESLLKTDYSNYDVIVVDNGSSKLEQQQIRKLKETYGVNKISVVELNTNLGFANANNVGIRIALQKGAEYILLLNNDTLVDPKFLREMIKVAHTDTKIGILGPKMFYYSNNNNKDREKRVWYAGGKVNMYFTHKQEAGKIDVGQYTNPKDVDYIAGACMLIRKEVFSAVGLLPREYFLGWEDIDFCISAKRRAGYRCIFVPGSYIWHKVSASYKRGNLSNKMVFYGFRNRVLMRYKFLPIHGFILFLVIHILIIMPVHMLFYCIKYKDASRISSMYKGLIAGIKERCNRRTLYRL
jgi:GT2 family glycosyltransferase